MKNLANYQESIITGVSCEDLGITFEEDGYSERTIIIRGTVAKTGKRFGAAILVDSNNEPMSSPCCFIAKGVENFEAACHIAGNKISDSFVGLLKYECREIAERFAKS